MQFEPVNGNELVERWNGHAILDRCIFQSIQKVEQVFRYLAGGTMNSLYQLSDLKEETKLTSSRGWSLDDLTDDLAVKLVPCISLRVGSAAFL
jgi:hypothetical protein